MQLPTIHWNGTSRAQLEGAYLGALGALARALRYLEDARPNARDYYPQGPDAFRLAQAEHAARVETLAKVSAELTELCEHCVNAPGQGQVPR